MTFMETLLYLREFNVVSILLRLCLALIFGGLIGLEREGSSRSAGLRTNSLVCIGATLIMLTGQYVYEVLGAQGDITRLGAQVVSGIGFLGAGTIINAEKHKIVGLTTAAALWICSGIGLALGIGFYEGAIIAWILTLLTLKILKIVDRKYKERKHFIDLYIELYDARKIDEIIDYLRLQEIITVSFVTVSPKLDVSAVGITFMGKSGRNTTPELIIHELGVLDNVSLVHKLYV